MRAEIPTLCVLSGFCLLVLVTSLIQEWCELMDKIESIKPDAEGLAYFV